MNCFHCDGEYEKVVQDYKGTFGKIYKILTCNLCGDECIDSENSKKIELVAEKRRKQVEMMMDIKKARSGEE
jgi:hypothetical protein